MMDQIISEQLSGNRTLQVHDLSRVSWLQPATVGDTGGPSGLPHGSFTWSVGADHNTLTVSPVKRKQGQPWDTFYFYKALVSAHPEPHCFSYGFQFAFPSQHDIDRCAALEFELAYREAGWIYKLAYQYRLLPTPMWCLYNKKVEQWIEFPQMPKPSPKPGQFVSMLAKFAIDRTFSMLTYEEIMIDGTRYAVGAIADGVFDNGPTIFNASIQADSDGQGNPFTLLFKGMTARSL